MWGEGLDVSSSFVLKRLTIDVLTNFFSQPLLDPRFFQVTRDQ